MPLTANLQTELTISPGLFQLSGGGQVVLNENLSSSTTGTAGNTLVSNSIQTDQQIRFNFNWAVNGLFVPLLNPGNKWKLEVFLEMMGPTESFSIPPVTVAYGVGGPYSSNVIIPPNTLSEGVYDVVAVLHFLDSANQPQFVAAFAEFGKICVYKDHP